MYFGKIKLFFFCIIDVYGYFEGIFFFLVIEIGVENECVLVIVSLLESG